MKQRILIAWFSRPGENYAEGKIVDLPVGNTEIAARKLAELTGGDLFQIAPVRPYAHDYQTCVRQSRQELAQNARPELAAYPEGLDGYDTVILAYPNWCGTMPMPVWTFLERYGFAGRKILPLCTNEGSGMGRSEADLKALCPDAVLGPGLSVRGSAVRDAGAGMADWLNRNL